MRNVMDWKGFGAAGKQVATETRLSRAMLTRDEYQINSYIYGKNQSTGVT